MSGKDWIFLAVAVAGVAFGIIQWLRPRTPRPAPVVQPDLRLARVGGLASSAGASPYVKAKLELANAEGAGSARGWEVSVAAVAGAKVGKAHLKGPVDFAPTVRWHHDATLPDIPSGQARELDGWLWVEGTSAEAGELALPLKLRAEAMPVKTGAIVVTFPASGREAALRIEL